MFIREQTLLSAVVALRRLCDYSTEPGTTINAYHANRQRTDGQQQKTRRCVAHSRHYAFSAIAVI